MLNRKLISKWKIVANSYRQVKIRKKKALILEDKSRHIDCYNSSAIYFIVFVFIVCFFKLPCPIKYIMP